MAFYPGYLAVTGFDACLAGDNILVDETGSPILDSDGDWILTEGCGRVVLPLQAWSCGLSGEDATCYQHRAITAGAGSVIVDGQATGAHRVVGAGAGANVTVGLPSGLARGRLVSAGPGVAVLTGSACAFVLAKRITANLGVYNITVSSATLDKVLVDSKEMAADSGAYTGAFQLAGLTGVRVGQLSPGALSATGAMSSGRMVRVMGASPAVLALSGAVSGLLRHSRIKSDPWSSVATWRNAGLARSVTIKPDPSTLAISGADASFARIRLVSMPAYPGAIAGSGAEASLAMSLIIESGPGDYQQVFTDSIMEHGWGAYFPVIDFSRSATLLNFASRSPASNFIRKQTPTDFTPPPIRN